MEKTVMTIQIVKRVGDNQP